MKTDIGSEGTAGDLDLWSTLAAAGPKAIAEALSPADIERMHIATPIETFVEEKVKQGISIILTGNAGDGKTHILRRIKPTLEAAGAIVVEDATAEMAGDASAAVLARWKLARAERRPFCMAANEYPLYQLRSAGERFDQLDEVFRQSRDRLAYRSEDDAEDARADILVIDLSLRNPLVESFFGKLLDVILSDPGLNTTIGEGRAPIAAKNREALRDRRVRQRLKALLDKLVAMGHRATVRELWILASRMVLGQSKGGDYLLPDWYSEALFRNDPRFPVTTALKAADPARCSHPRWDSKLEERAQAVKNFFANLTPEEQAALAVTNPSLVGNLDGVPVNVRFAANRISIQK